MEPGLRNVFLAGAVVLAACFVIGLYRGLSAHSPYVVPDRPATPARHPGAAAGTWSNSVPVSRAEYGEKWPLSVDAGVLYAVTRPVDGRLLTAVVFETGGRSYAVNGWATTWQLGADIRPIWQDSADGLGLKKNLGPLIDRGMKLYP